MGAEKCSRNLSDVGLGQEVSIAVVLRWKIRVCAELSGDTQRDPSTVMSPTLYWPLHQYPRV